MAFELFSLTLVIEVFLLIYDKSAHLLFSQILNTLLDCVLFYFMFYYSKQLINKYNIYIYKVEILLP